MDKMPARIIKQHGVNLSDLRTIQAFAFMRNIPLMPLGSEDVESFDLLPEDLPVGSVEFLRAVMSHLSIPEPKNLSYPETLREFLLRDVRETTLDRVLPGEFVKPQQTKAFTGFVWPAAGVDLCEHDKEQASVAAALPPKTSVWAANAVSWQAEYRAYVHEGAVVGLCRYDDLEEEFEPPPEALLLQMVSKFQPFAPVSYALDIGLIQGRGWALVECNDAWALGLYKGTLQTSSYIQMLFDRWKELMGSRQRSHSPAG